MSKRQLSLSDDESQPLPGEAPTKLIKRAQTENLDSNLVGTNGKQKKQAQLTSFFASKNNDNKSSKIEIEEEKEASPELKNKDTMLTEIIIESDSDVSYYSEGADQPTVKKESDAVDLSKKLKDMPNAMFYLNLMQSRPQGDFIDKIHKYWKYDYKKLEIHHGYVQWIFPNFYGSAFNRDAYRLQPEEAKIFRERKDIAERLVRSYEMMMGFYGIRLADKKTGRLERASNYEERYKATLITSLHNHLRIRRILAHLNVVGFRPYAIELVNFIEKEMYGEVGGYKIHQEMERSLKVEYIRKIKGNPLFAIIKYDVLKDWKIYGEVKTEEEREVLYKNCFTSDEKDYEPSILLRS